ncbi:MAG: phosphonate ABC transporter ATP-binding protein [Saprospiraceae bacterium]|nr:MAG: phosphonate ABC transporter ATP-binding protein [Saprospiraceae bacterium]
MTENKASIKEVKPGLGLILELKTATDNDKPIYLAGNFNNWEAPDENYRLKKIDAGHYRFVFPNREILPIPLEYKYLRGNWQQVELDEYSNTTPNRQLWSLEDRVLDYVPQWQKDGLDYPADKLPIIEILSEDFEIPQLIKTRRISVLLPHNYHKTDQRYPVLYLQDGQNLFDDFAPFGNWAVNKKLAVLTEKGFGDIIVVAIDHAEEDRIAEFTPSFNTKLGRGDGKKYVRFLANTLKPYVDKHFRTKPGCKDTGIGGSSMGGLISIYAGFMYPEVYNKLMIFSPSLWVSPTVPFQIINFEDIPDMKIYLYGGAAEGESMIPNLKRFRETINRQGQARKFDFNLSIDPKGQHNEARWGEEFPKAVEWLFFNNLGKR